MDNVEKVDLDHVDWKSSREFFESLGEALDKLDDKDESYNFTWVGKRKSIVEAGAPINKTLRPCISESENFDSTKNMLVVGDNLDALKLLQESYLGKINLIYIDPPYNTGHDFVYHDNFTIKKSDYEDSSINEDGELLVSEDRYLENARSNGRFHSDWLSMMLPRLRLARNLMADNGLIFLSIDENEISNLKKLCDEVFGEESYVSILHWKKKKQPSFLSRVAGVIEYLLVYEKTPGETKKLSVESIQDSNKPILNAGNPLQVLSFPAGIKVKAKISSISAGTTDASGGVKYLDDVNVRDGRTVNEFKVEAHFRNNQESLNKYISEDLVFITSSLSLRRDVSEEESGKSKSITDLLLDWGQNQDSDKEQLEFFGKRYFSNPKPTLYIKNIIKSAMLDDNAYVMDFFAGSGTTGHSLLQLNVEENMHCHYILSQLDEPVQAGSDAEKDGYTTIDQITIERLRRAGKSISDNNPSSDLDCGFRVFRIDSSNQKDDIRKNLGEVQQSNLFEAIDNVKKDRTPLDLLFGVVYVSALPFDLKLETRKIGENTVYLYGYLDEGTGLVACFDDNIPEETIKEIANLKALTAAFKDSSFADSVAKINLSEHFRIISPDTKVKVI